MVGPAIFISTVLALENIFSDEFIKQNSNIKTSEEIVGLEKQQVPNIQVLTGIVIQIVDFNTIKVLTNDGIQEVYLIGISKNTLCSDELIIQAMQDLALGKKVYMIDDNTYESEFNYNYAFMDKALFLNQELIKRGVSKVNSEKNYIYKEDFIKLDKNDGSCEIEPIDKPKQEEKTEYTNNLYSKLLVTATPIPTKTPTPTPSPESGVQLKTTQPQGEKPSSLNPDILFVMINNHRQSIGKPPFEKDGQLCSLAVSRGPELYDEIFKNHNVHAGLNNRNLPYWITENMAHYDTEEKVFSWWMNSGLHRRAIEGDFKYSCGECYGNSCAQLFTSYTPK